MALTQVQGGMLAGSSNTVTTIQSNGTTAITIDASQNVGIGVTPSNWGSAYKALQVGLNASVAGNASGSVALLSTNAFFDGSSFKYITTDAATQYQQNTGEHIWRTAASGTAGATLTFSERMRITSAGSLLVGTTAPISAGFTTISYDGTALNGLVISESANSSGTAFLAFNNGATNIGSVSRVGATSAVQYSTTSDQRLKSNIADANPVLDKLMDVKVRQFDWTDGDLHQDAGFIAQELAPVLSGIVTEGKTTEDMWQVDYSRLTPYLVKAIQELNAKVDAQAAEIAALKAAK